MAAACGDAAARHGWRLQALPAQPPSRAPGTSGAAARRWSAWRAGARPAAGPVGGGAARGGETQERRRARAGATAAAAQSLHRPLLQAHLVGLVRRPHVAQQLPARVWNKYIGVQGQGACLGPRRPPACRRYWRRCAGAARGLSHQRAPGMGALAGHSQQRRSAAGPCWRSRATQFVRSAQHMDCVLKRTQRPPARMQQPTHRASLQLASPSMAAALSGALAEAAPEEGLAAALGPRRRCTAATQCNEDPGAASCVPKCRPRCAAASVGDTDSGARRSAHPSCCSPPGSTPDRFVGSQCVVKQSQLCQCCRRPAIPPPPAAAARAPPPRRTPPRRAPSPGSFRRPPAAPGGA